MSKASAQTYTIATLLEKLGSPDKDFRYMAANDLIVELQKETLLLDDETEKRVVSGIMKALDDKNGEVQNLAVKWYVYGSGNTDFGETIKQHYISGKDLAQLRDISSMALKTLLQELPVSNQTLVGKLSGRVTSKLHLYICKEKLAEVAIHLEVLEIIATLLQKNGQHLAAHHSTLLEAFLPLLKNPRMAVRKRAIAALSNLVNVCSDEMFEGLIKRLAFDVGQSKDLNDAKTTVQLLEGISRAAGPRFGSHLGLFIGSVIKFADKDDDELREHVFHTLEAFLQKCPAEVTPHINDIVAVSMQRLSYDPNYSYGEEEEDAEVAEDDEGQFSDDDDISWKVRRAAVKCLEAVITTRGELVTDCLKRFGPALVARFIDREETVRVDVINAFSALLQQLDNTLGEPRRRKEMAEVNNTESKVHEALRQQLPALMKSLKKLIVDKSSKCRQASLQLLGRLVSVYPGCLTEYFDDLLPGFKSCLTDKSAPSNIKLEVLSVLRSIFPSHPPELFAKNAKLLIEIISHCVRDTFYKVIAESLAALQDLISILRPFDRPLNLDMSPFLSDLFAAVFLRFKDPALDQEIKEKAVACMGQLLFSLGDQLRAELPQKCLPVFVERLKNEPTRLPTMRALVKVVSSRVQNDISPVLDDVLKLSSQFLRKNLRNLRLVTLELLAAIIRDYGQRISEAVIVNLIKELPALIQETDLMVAQTGLQVVAAAAAHHPAAVIANKDIIVPQIVEIGRSSVVQGAALQAVIDALKAIASIGGQRDPGLTAASLIQKFLQPFYTTQQTQKTPELIFSASHRQAFLGTAKCVASLAVAGGIQVQTAATCVQDILAEGSSDTIKMIALAVLAEIGYYSDLSMLPGLKEALNAVFEQGRDDCKTLASVTLGKLCGGNVAVFVPSIISQLDTDNDKQYVLLNALKELINLVPSERVSAEALAPFAQSIWNALVARAGSVEEGYRNLLGECLGKLTALDPSRLVPSLVDVLKKTDQAQVRCTVITAIKYTISDERRPVDSVLKDSIGQFLDYLKDSDLTVRRTALTLFNSIAHNKPALLKDKLPRLLPLVYKETIIKPELIREVEMGPFKHEVDDGLDCRKAAYEALYTLLDSCLDQLNVFEFIEHVVRGLNDHYDIKTLCFLFIRRLVQAAPAAVAERLEAFAVEITKVLNTKVKPNAVKQEYEKTDELRRMALRAVSALTLLPDAENSRSINDLRNLIKSNQELGTLWEQIKTEATPGASGSYNDNAMDTS